MKKYILSLVTFCFLTGCNNDTSSSSGTTPTEGGNNDKQSTRPSAAGKHFIGSFSNGMKGNKFSFDISADGSKLENLTFEGYWYCDGKLDLTTAGPDGAFDIENNKVNQHISEPPNGGSTAWRFDLTADINGSEASGTFRMNINNLGCNTGMLNWTATAR